MEKGDFFGEMALIESEPHSASAEALSRCDLIEINSTLFDKMIRGNIEIAVRMLRKLSVRLRNAERLLEQYASGAGVSAQVPVEEALVAVEAQQGAATVIIRPEGAAPASGQARPDPEGIEAPEGGHAFFRSPDGSQIFWLTSEKATIGRFDPVTGLRPEVDLSALDLNRSVSRHHAHVRREESGYTVTEEVGALNGTFVNGTRLTSGKAAPLQNGDELSLGVVKLSFKTR